MADTGGERITNTFQFCHHAIPVPTITTTDRILHATARLTAAIAGVQEALPDKLNAIQALRTLLLGKVPPTEPTTPQVSALHPFHDEEPVFIWSPDQVNRQHITTLPSHQRVRQPVQPLRPSSFRTPMMNHYHQPSLDALPGRTPHPHPSPHVLASTYVHHT